ncbi:MFS transporter [Hoyosella rhizosphaerae]|nr:MFS transporter [Hoyosella rhizosphaerae]
MPIKSRSREVRRLSWPLYAYSLSSEFVLLYPFYAIFFADSGLSVAQITSLFAIWSLASVLLEVPSGVLADIVPRRYLLAAAPLFAGTAFSLWLLFPHYWAFALGFILWGAGGTLSSGALEALVFTELDHRGAAPQYATVMGIARTYEVCAVGLSTIVAIPVMTLGGYVAVGVGSVLACVVCSAIGLLLPELRLPAPRDDHEVRTVMRAGMREVFRSKAVLAAVALAAIIPAIWENLEEYVPLLASEHGVNTEAIPWVVLTVWVGVAGGGLFSGPAARLSSRQFSALLAVAASLMAVGALAGGPAGWIALGVAFGALQAAGVAADARLQHRISGESRATVTSAAGVGAEVMTLVVLLSYLGVFTVSSHSVAFAALAVPYVLVSLALVMGSSARSRLCAQTSGSAP